MCLEALLASHVGILGRLKVCTNPSCGAAFYDLSRNSTRVWHDMKTCGNTMNLRASRARRRSTTQLRQTTAGTEPSPGPPH
ncbi:CGNR zinc finger domain-containing protein [Dactylosporangium vinaceum]|uniref:CGNR zinc finger domain-containing protein n=1 Tax=Dactylosporangium vinaceum TaxID=53362 RepID=A0ABV5M7B1_9ACTN